MTTAVDTSVVIALWDKDATLSLAAPNALDAAFCRGTLSPSKARSAGLLAHPRGEERHCSLHTHPCDGEVLHPLDSKDLGWDRDVRHRGHSPHYAPQLARDGDVCPHARPSCPYAVASTSARLPTFRGNLTTVAQKPSLGIEQATSPYSFRSSELSQPI